MKTFSDFTLADLRDLAAGLADAKLTHDPHLSVRSRLALIEVVQSEIALREAGLREGSADNPNRGRINWLLTLAAGASGSHVSIDVGMVRNIAGRLSASNPNRGLVGWLLSLVERASGADVSMDVGMVRHIANRLNDTGADR